MMVDVSYLRVFQHRTTGRRMLERYCLFQPLCWREDLIHDDNPNGENGWRFVEFIPYERNEIYTVIRKLRFIIEHPPIMSFDLSYPSVRFHFDTPHNAPIGGLGTKLQDGDEDYDKPYVFGIVDDIATDDSQGALKDITVSVLEATRMADKALDETQPKPPPSLRPGSVSLVASQTLYYLQNGWNLTPVKGTDNNGDDYWWLEDATKNPKKPQVFDILGKTEPHDNFTPPFNNGIAMPFDTPHNAPIEPTLRLALLGAVRDKVASRWDMITYSYFRDAYAPIMIANSVKKEPHLHHWLGCLQSRDGKKEYHRHSYYFDNEKYYVPFDIPKWIKLDSR
jgi:hypothetical protein